jgi:hypothetical protein
LSALKPLLSVSEVARLMGHDRSTAYRLLRSLDDAFGGRILVTVGGNRRKRRKAVTSALQEALQMREAGELITMRERVGALEAWREDVDRWRGVMTESQVQVAQRISTMPPR